MIQRIVALDEIPTLVGEIFSSDFRFTYDDIAGFERATRVTEMYEGTFPDDYPDWMIEGFMSVSFLDFLVTRMFRPDPNTCVGFNYGLDRVRFPSVMTGNDELTFVVEVKDATPRKGGYLLTYHCTLGVVGRDVPGLVADWLVLVVPRTTSTFKEELVPNRSTPTSEEI